MGLSENFSFLNEMVVLRQGAFKKSLDPEQVSPVNGIRAEQ